MAAFRGEKSLTADNTDFREFKAFENSSAVLATDWHRFSQIKGLASSYLW